MILSRHYFSICFNCAETEIQKYAKVRNFPIIPCNLCGSQENLQRVQIKKMLQTWERETPGRINSLFHSLQNVSPSHLADTDLFNFTELNQTTKSDN